MKNKPIPITSRFTDKFRQNIKFGDIIVFSGSACEKIRGRFIYLRDTLTGINYINVPLNKSHHYTTFYHNEGFQISQRLKGSFVYYAAANVIKIGSVNYKTKRIEWINSYFEDWFKETGIGFNDTKVDFDKFEQIIRDMEVPEDVT
jgi:ASC-1-like (ASCH) protein